MKPIIPIIIQLLLIFKYNHRLRKYIQFRLQNQNVIDSINKFFTKNKELLKELQKIMKLIIQKPTHNKVDVNLKKQQTDHNKIPTNGDDKDKRNDEDKEEEEEVQEDNLEDLGKTMSQYLNSIVFLLALFSEEHDSCDNVISCLENTLKQIEKTPLQCSCEHIDISDIIDCFLNSAQVTKKSTKKKPILLRVKSIAFFLNFKNTFFIQKKKKLLPGCEFV